MIKIESIHVEEVRGIRKLDIDFKEGPFAISGPNGSGKSGVIDAIEFGLTGQIGRLTGRGTPFGRGGQVRVWETPDGTAVELDEAYPLALPLRRLLVRLAEVYPLPQVPTMKRPDPLPPQAWAGDRLALFGSAFPTKILMTLAGRGWTFEAVCCESHSKDDGADNRRVLTKKVIRRLEAEGVLEGSRPRGPGFGPRLLRIADTFPAEDELQALIDAIPAAWPDLGDRIEAAFAAVPEKTKTYFRRRGLWNDAPPGSVLA